MALWPSFRYDIQGRQPTNLGAGTWLNSRGTSTYQRLGIFGVIAQSSSIPDGGAGESVMLNLPITSGAMSARSYATLTGAANMIRGTLLSGQASATMTGAANLGLVTAMTATFSSSITMGTPNLSLALGMQATGTATMTGTANLAMIVPLGNATWSASFNGAADLKGNLSMSASFGGAEPLSPESLAAAVLAAAAETPIHANVQQLNDAEVIGTGTTGDSWRGVGVSP